MTSTQIKTVNVDEMQVFYREAGQPNSKTVLLLHGFPSVSNADCSSSHDFTDLYLHTSLLISIGISFRD